MPRDAQGFDRAVALPPGLTIGHIRKAIEYVERQAEAFADLYYEQANIFSGLVGILGVRALHALESKGSTRPWAVQSHYDHPGWYIVWRYAVDPTKQMKPGRVVLVWRVDVPFIRKGDWKYEGSRAGEGRGGRTHTFGIKNPAKLLAGAIVYQAPGIAVHGGKPIAANGNGHG